jgi:hypothetical protein
VPGTGEGERGTGILKERSLESTAGKRYYLLPAVTVSAIGVGFNGYYLPISA